MNQITCHITEKEEGTRLDKVLQDASGLTRSEVQNQMKEEGLSFPPAKCFGPIIM